MNLKISGFMEFMGWICSLDFIKVTKTHIGLEGHIDSSWELSL